MLAEYKGNGSARGSTSVSRSFTWQNAKQNTMACIFSNAKNKEQKACSIVLSLST